MRGGRNWALRPAEEEDLAFLYQVKKASNLGYIAALQGWDEEGQRRAFARDFQRRREFSVITVDGADAGFLQLQRGADFLNVAELHLLPSFRSRGIGSAVLKHLQAQAVDLPLLIGCFQANKEALRLYRRLGFIPVTETDTHVILIHDPTKQEE